MAFSRIVLVLIAVFAALQLPACKASLDESGPEAMTRHVIEHDGLQREYFVFLPSVYDAAAKNPVSIFLHGYGGTATGTEAEVTQGLNFYAEKFGYVMVYPQSTWFMAGETKDSQWEASSWNHISDGFDQGPEGPICLPDAAPYVCPPECGDCGECGWASCNDDVGFLKKLVAQIDADFSIDDDSVFVTGFSNGSMMANRIACEASELFAAVALVGGRVEPGFECTPTKALPLLQINGGKDGAVPPSGEPSQGGYLFAKTTAIAEHWVTESGCSVDNQPWTTAILENENVQCTIACGETEHPSIDCIWPEGNHRWPGTPGFRGSNGYCVTELQSASMPQQTICIDPDPAAEIWGSQLVFEFFDTYRGK